VLNASAHSAEVRRLRAERPTSQLLRWTLVTLGLFVLYAWTSPEIALSEFLDARRLRNLGHFFETELVPFPLREDGFEFAGLWMWISGTWESVGAESTLATFLISVVAIAFAALIAVVLAPLVARNVSTTEPFGDGACHAPTWQCWGWGAVRRCARSLAILFRAVPEYVLAFLLLAVLGPGTAWPAVIALAIHNGGILGRLGGEVIENLEPAPLQALTGLGARRRQVLAFGVFPISLGRNLLYFFYRFETCVREATVLGMLGVVSLGYWIQDARAKQFYDEMLLLVIFGVLLVVVADLISALARAFLR